MSKATRQLTLGLLAAALVSVALGLLAQATGILHGIEQRSVAARFDVRGASTPKDIVVVAIDDKTFAELGIQWPFPRSLHGKAIDRLAAAGARTIVYDVQFTERTTNREDNALYASLERSGGAVLATSEFDEKGRTNVLGGEDNLAAAGSVAAAANMPDDSTGLFDHFPYASGPLRSLAVTAAARAGAPALARSAFDADGAWIDFRGPPGTITTVSFSSLIRGKLDPALFRDRVVVVGASAPSLQDVHPTPAAAEPMAGPEVQANAIWTALNGLPLRDAPATLSVLLLVLLGVAVPLLRLRFRVLPAALAAPVVAAAFLVGAQVAFGRGSIIWFSTPLLALALGTVTMIVVSHLFESAARRRVSHDNDVLEGMVRERTQELRETQLEIFHRLSRAAEWRDEDTGQHVARMGRLSHRLACAAGLSPEEGERIGNAAVAHDIGKIATPDRILLKPGPLTPDERDEMQRHALIGASMLSDSRSPVMQLAEVIARTHHERWDGTGYPDGLEGTEIPLAGRICGLCDVFDALVSRRPYKESWTLDAALEEIQAQSGSHFDPMLVEAFAGIAVGLYAEMYAERRTPPQATGSIRSPTGALSH